MHDPELVSECERCRKPLPDPCFLLSLAVDRPDSQVFRMRICGSCHASLDGWISRRPLRLRSGKRRTVYTDELDRKERQIHNTSWWLVAGAFAAAVVALGVVMFRLRYR